MHVFVTVATGWAGSAVAKKLIGPGRKVTELVPSRPHERSVQLRTGPCPVRHRQRDGMRDTRDIAAGEGASY
jgi:nucleoside-diphosphate-sugar epimerase